MSANKELVPKMSSTSKQEKRKAKDASSLTPIRENKELPELRRKPNAMDSWKHPPLRNDFIPEEIFVALTSAANPVPCPSYLRPPTKAKYTKDFQGCIRTADGVWQHPVRRNRFRYLIQHPICLTGAGRDVSFLYDVIAEKERRTPPPTPVPDKSVSQRSGKEEADVAKPATDIAESLVPEEFHIVKNRGVIGLEYYDDKYTTLLEDHENRLRVFPSLKPSGRLEVIQLLKVMDMMLEKAGVDNEETGISGLSQMHNALEVLKMEQNIYNIVFHEVIRQVSVDCMERGELLSKLRQRYVDLLDRIPRQMDNLCKEMVAQRVLDKHIMDELFRFKEAVGKLTRELQMVREHDCRATIDAERTHKELAKAIWESELNANLLDEYRELYELQRARLEAQIQQLTEEKELWSSATYDLALKVMQRNKVILARRLYASEKAWTNVMRHFTLLLASEDAADLSTLQQLTQDYRELLYRIDTEVKQAEESSRDQFNIIQNGLNGWLSYFRDHVLGKGAYTTAKGAALLDEIMVDLKAWEKILNKQLDLYGGDVHLERKEPLAAAEKLQRQWMELGNGILSRHKTLEGKMPPESKLLEDVNKSCTNLCRQYAVRIGGENGVSRILTSLTNSLEDWTFRMLASKQKSGMLENDWVKFFQSVSDWLIQMADLSKFIGSGETPEDRRLRIIVTPIRPEDLFKKIQLWILTTSSGAEKGNIQLTQEMTEFHNILSKWMVNLLLLMVPDHISHESLPLTHSQVAREAERKLLDVFRLEGEAASLAAKLSKFSIYVVSCCKDMVASITRKKFANYDPDAECEWRQLDRIKTECLDWIQTCTILLSGMKTVPTTLISTEELVSLFGEEALQPKPQLSPHPEEERDTSPEEAEEAPEEQKKDEVEESGSKEPVTEKDMQETLQKIPTLTAKESVTEKEVLETQQQPPVPSTSTDQEAVSAEGAQLLRFIGPDSNVHTRTIETEQVTVSGRELYASQWTTKYSGKEFQMLASLEILEERLLEAEKRAQLAEEKSENLHEQLEAALSKLQDLGELEDGEAKEEATPETESKAKSAYCSTAPYAPRTSSSALTTLRACIAVGIMAVAPGHQLPEFNPTRPDLWESWVDRLMYYIQLHKMEEADDQKALVLSSCGVETLQLIKHLTAPTTLAATTYKGLIEAVTNHLSPQPTHLARWHTFYARQQRQAESAVDYLSELRGLTLHCDFMGDLEEILLNQFVVGVREEKLLWKLLATNHITLTLALPTGDCL
ncbi:axonemal dynein light chain domain-containing protein 1 [Heteronotia binoei]|uniref:axonemal dynein light chain domain-containing protein 1 n=1 Tax=Heteronotia binoei TaxID=13085 RepID=UPI00293170EC|nr:axonemal dynein light chain domain-containing protein 1 [Heteronotia binoei]